ncbi:uncharacterized protein G2W53_006963 [Senna tora]|uniref:GRF-type domain-containing protein n=1 Tax=Senna tora TaxID=362788 RepID=A0A835CD22_9FABA|nr:uncharacterized protein G2W53_006963 [Senna tora]
MTIATTVSRGGLGVTMRVVVMDSGGDGGGEGQFGHLPSMVAEAAIKGAERRVAEEGERAIILTSRTDENPGRRFWRCRKYQTANDCDFFDWFEQDGKDIVIGRLRMKIATLNGTVTRLKKLNKLLLVFTVFLVVAFATIMLFIWGFVFFLGVVLGLRTVGVAGPSLEANDLTTVVLVLIGDRSGVGWDEAPAWGVGGGAVEVPAGWVEAGTGCGVDEPPAG